VPSAAASELIAVSPGRQLRPLRLADPNERRSFAQPSHADIVSGHAQPAGAKRPFTLLDRLPSFVERHEIPALAYAADHPQPSLGPIEGQTAADGKVLDRLVRP
jgi:hypothetical protein